MPHIEGDHIRDDKGEIGLSPAGIAKLEASQRPGPDENKETAKAIGTSAIVVILWELYRFFIRSLYGLPHWVHLVLYFLLGVAICTAIYLVIAAVARRVVRKGLSFKARAIIYALVFTAFISNFIGLPATEVTGATGPNSTNIVIVPARGTSVAVGVSGSTVRVVVRPSDGVQVLAQAKPVDLRTYKPHVFDELRFKSSDGKARQIYVQQFAHEPSQEELTAPLPAVPKPRAHRNR